MVEVEDEELLLNVIRLLEEADGALVTAGYTSSDPLRKKVYDAIEEAKNRLKAHVWVAYMEEKGI
jgi:hypothetical protein